MIQCTRSTASFRELGQFVYLRHENESMQHIKSLIFRLRKNYAYVKRLMIISYQP